MKDMAVPPSSYAPIFSAPSFLRIAIPSWRSIGIQYRPEPVAEPASLSREEIQSLFHGELRPASRAPKLTEAEEREQSLADRMRKALYPGAADH